MLRHDFSDQGFYGLVTPGRSAVSAISEFFLITSPSSEVAQEHDVKTRPLTSNVWLGLQKLKVVRVRSATWGGLTPW